MEDGGWRLSSCSTRHHPLPTKYKDAQTWRHGVNIFTHKHSENAFQRFCSIRTTPAAMLKIFVHNSGCLKLHASHSEKGGVITTLYEIEECELLAGTGRCNGSFHVVSSE